MSKFDVLADGVTDPIDIPEEHLGKMEALMGALTRLEGLRAEMGRIFQMLSNVQTQASSTEGSARDLKKVLCDACGVTQDGSWMVDSDKQQLIRVKEGGPSVV